jgi:hypothetical protein
MAICKGGDIVLLNSFLLKKEDRNPGDNRDSINVPLTLNTPSAQAENIAVSKYGSHNSP